MSIDEKIERLKTDFNSALNLGETNAQNIKSLHKELNSIEADLTEKIVRLASRLFLIEKKKI